MIRGATAQRAAWAVETGTPLPGTAGFAGELPDGTLVSDVLGRVPLFVDGERWAFDPEELSDPERFPAGHVGTPREGETRRCWSLPEPPALPQRVAAGRLRRALRVTLDDTESENLAVAFSGGVDSAVVASATDAPLYVAGFPDSPDVATARESARLMDRELRVVNIDAGTLEAAMPAVARATGRTNPMDVAIATPLYLVAERARADGYDRLAVGQGADELFGGYEKVARAPSDPRVEAETVRSARDETVATLPEQLERDVRALQSVGVEAVAPLLHDRVVDAALRLPAESLVDARGERKAGFRRAARAFVPDRVAFRGKKAVQYGTLVARELDRLAREAGFKSRTEHNVRRYVESRL